MTMSIPHQGCLYLFHPSRHGHRVQISLVTIFHIVISIQIHIIIFVIVVVIIIILNLRDGIHTNKITH